MSRKRSREALESHWHPVPRRRRRERGVRSDRPHGVRQGGRLLGVRLPQEPRRCLRHPRLPVGLAAPRLSGRVPVLAPERPADGLLPAGDAAARRRAARRRDPPAGCQPQPGRLLGRGSAARRCGSAWATSKASAPAPSGWSPNATETGASQIWATWCGARRLQPTCSSRWSKPAPATGSAIRRQLLWELRLHRAPAGRRARSPAGTGARCLPHPGASADERLGADGGRPRDHEPDHRPSSDGAAATQHRRARSASAASTSRRHRRTGSRSPG